MSKLLYVNGPGGARLFFVKSGGWLSLSKNEVISLKEYEQGRKNT